jgi:hypothetical protein
VQYCNGATVPMYGYVRINSLVPIQQIADDLPTLWSSTPYNSVLPNTLVVAPAQVIINANVAMPITVSGGEYSIDDGPFTSLPGTINPGQSFRLRQISSAIPGRTASMTVNIGRASASYTVTTTVDATPPAGLPGSPVILGAAAGDGSVTIHFRPPRETGGLPILGYVVSCDGDFSYEAGTTSPVTRTGLVNGRTYMCSVIARNANGLGGASYSRGYMPFATMPLYTIGVVSRKTHGSAGVFDLPIDSWVYILGNVTVEPRQAGDGHELVFFFNRPITVPGSATVTDENMTSFGNATVTASGYSISVKLPPIADGKRTRVTLSGVNGGLEQFYASIGFLNGDINSSRTVGAADIVATKARGGQPLSYYNYLSDIDLSGEINAADRSLIKASAGARLP